MTTTSIPATDHPDHDYDPDPQVLTLYGGDVVRIRAAARGHVHVLPLDWPNATARIVGDGATVWMAAGRYQIIGDADIFFE